MEAPRGAGSKDPAAQKGGCLCRWVSVQGSESCVCFSSLHSHKSSRQQDATLLFRHVERRFPAMLPFSAWVLGVTVNSCLKGLGDIFQTPGMKVNSISCGISFLMKKNRTIIDLTS